MAPKLRQSMPSDPASSRATPCRSLNGFAQLPAPPAWWRVQSICPSRNCATRSSNTAAPGAPSKWRDWVSGGPLSGWTASSRSTTGLIPAFPTGSISRVSSPARSPTARTSVRTVKNWSLCGTKPIPRTWLKCREINLVCTVEDIIYRFKTARRIETTGGLLFSTLI